RRLVPALDVNEDIGIQELHRSGTRPPFRLLPQHAGMSLTIRNVGSSADEPFALPVRKQFGASTGRRSRTSSRDEETQNILRKREAELGSFSGEFGFQLGR